MKFKARRELPRARIEIIPMIDTIFFLLVFFMLSSLSLTRLRGLPVDLPDAKTATAQQSSDLTLTIDARGRLFLEKVPVAWPDLQRALLAKAGAATGNSRSSSGRGAQAARSNQSPGQSPDLSPDLSRVSLVINADRRVAHGVVIRAIDTARDIGITRYGIATSASSASSASSATDSVLEAPAAR